MGLDKKATKATQKKTKEIIQRHRLKPADYIEAIKASNGLISVAARTLDVDRKQVYKFAARHESVAEAIADARERTTDLAEGKLFKLINDENVPAIIFYLKTQAKNRGYVEQTQVQHSGSLTVEAVAKLSDDEVERLALERGLPDVD